jgi:phosphoserine phosphatase
MNENDPKVAIFDLDNTILRADSDYEMVNFLISKNLINKSIKNLTMIILLHMDRGILILTSSQNFH